MDLCWSAMTDPTPFGVSVIHKPPARRARLNEIEAMRQQVHPSKCTAIALLGSLATLGLCGLQFGNRNGLNSLPFSQVRPLVSDLGRAQNLAKLGNIEILTGQEVAGQAVRLRGELTDGNCYLGNHHHGYDHAFCAKLCVAAGSPLLFVPDEQRKPLIVLTKQHGIQLPEDVLDHIGVPGVVVKGNLLEVGGLEALAMSKIER